MKIRNLLWMALVLANAMVTDICCGQSIFRFKNRDAGLDAPVFDSTGNRLSGTNYVAVLYGGPTVDSLTPAWDAPGVSMAPIPFTFMPLGQAGYFNRNGFVTVGNVFCAGFAWLQVRAWDVRLGSSYEEVATLSLGGYGESNLFQKQGGREGGFCPGSPIPPGDLIGLESFALREVIPEPSSTLLLLLGLPVLLLLRRRRSK